MASGSLKAKDNGYNKLIKELLKNDKPLIKVGILAKDASVQHKDRDGKGTPLTVLDVGTVHEFGLGVPQRSFIGAWFDLEAVKLGEELKKMMQLVVQGKYEKWQAFEIIGQRAVGGIQKRIADGIKPANHPLTIAIKGSSTPLIDTGQLRTSISYLVEGVSK